MDAAIRPEGWHHWEPQREKTAYFAEYGSTGKGANAEARVAWARKLGDADVKQFSVEYFLSGRDGWDPYRIRMTPGWKRRRPIGSSLRGTRSSNKSRSGTKPTKRHVSPIR